jgi:AraC-like DNA-binding protein
MESPKKPQSLPPQFHHPQPGWALVPAECGGLELSAAAHFRCTELATLLHCSDRQRRRRIRQRFGTAPQEWLNAARLKIAMNQLGQGVPANRVAQTLGFKNSSYFSTWFKLGSGVSPSQFYDQGL